MYEMPICTFSCRIFLSYALCAIYRSLMMICTCAVIVGVQCTKLALKKLQLRRLHEKLAIPFLTKTCVCVFNVPTPVIIVWQNHIKQHLKSIMSIWLTMLTLTATAIVVIPTHAFDVVSFEHCRSLNNCHQHLLRKLKWSCRKLILKCAVKNFFNSFAKL